MDKDFLIKSFNAEIEALRTHIAYFEQINNVISEYEKKTVNKCFINFLKRKISFTDIRLPKIEWYRNLVETKNNLTSVTYGIFELTLQTVKRDFPYTVISRLNSHQACHYIDYDKFSAYIYTDNVYKLDSEKTKASIKETIEQINKIIANYQDAINNFDVYAEANEKIKKEICEYQKNCNSLLRLRINVFLT